MWERRHRALLALLWLHAAGLPVYALVRGYGLGHSLAEGLPVLALACLSHVVARRSPRLRAGLVAAGLMTCSAVVVHLSAGSIEAHFHFFVMLSLLLLYEDWIPFLVAMAYVVGHHGLMGVLAADTVYAHASGQEHPWRWALIHGVFVGAASIANIVSWRLNEDVRRATKAADEAQLAKVEAQLLQSQKMEAVPARRRRRARLQQPAHGHLRLRRAGAAPPRRPGPGAGGHRGDAQGCRQGRLADAAAARVQPKAGAPADRPRPQRGRRRDREHAPSPDRRGHRRRDCPRSRPRPRQGGLRPDPAGAREPGAERAGRDARWRPPDDPDGERRAPRRPPRERGAGQLRRRHAQRHGLRNGRRDAVARLRAVLHDEGSGEGHRPRPLDRLRDRHAERRRRLGRERARAGHDADGLPAAD